MAPSGNLHAQTQTHSSMRKRIPAVIDDDTLVAVGVEKSDCVAAGAEISGSLKPERSTSSRALGWIDILYCRFRQCMEPTTRRWFTLGYGDLPAYFSEAQQMMLAWQDSGLSCLDEALEIEWQPWEEE